MSREWMEVLEGEAREGREACLLALLKGTQHRPG